MGKGLKFHVSLTIQSLSAVPYHNAIVFCKIRHKNGSAFTSRQPVRQNVVTWDETVEFPFKTKVKKDGMVASKTISICVKREVDGGRRIVKSGEVVVNLAEFAGRSDVERRYLLQSSSSKKDNSMLKITVSARLMEGPTIFKAPTASDFAAPRLDSDDRLESDSMSRDSSSTPRPLSEIRDNPDELVDALLAEAAGSMGTTRSL